MYSIAFPNIFQNKLKTNLFKDKDATASNLWLLLNSDKLTLFGDPYFGTGLKKAIFEQGDVVLVDILIDEIFTVISTFMPQLSLDRNDISIEKRKSKFYVKVKCTDLTDYTTNLYEIDLTDKLTGDYN